MPPTVLPDTLIEISEAREPYWKHRLRPSSRTRLKWIAWSMDMTVVALIDLLARYHFDVLRKDMTADQRRRLDAGKMTAGELQNIIRARVIARRRKRRDDDGDDDRVPTDAPAPAGKMLEPAA
jgi:hypothetical protein